MISYKGGDGSSKQKAIIILGATTEFEGVDAEYDYLDNNYPGWELVEQAFYENYERQYDILTIQLSDQSKKEIWFDITDFYGK